jgi:Arc-like DNA binding domain
MARKLSDTVQLNLRFSEKLRRRIERDATKNGRSMNQEIVERLEAPTMDEALQERLWKLVLQLPETHEAIVVLSQSLPQISMKLDVILKTHGQALNAILKRLDKIEEQLKT